VHNTAWNNYYDSHVTDSEVIEENDEKKGRLSGEVRASYMRLLMMLIAIVCDSLAASSLCFFVMNSL
jgi:hypothetical protein